MLHLWLLPTAVAAASSIVHPWEDFHSWPVAGAPPGVRRFSSSEHHRLRDGRGLHLSWEVDADPASILALDWEQQQRSGVSLVGCDRERLTLRVPREHAARLQRWQFVTSSHFHSCPHLAGRDLYHRVLRVEERSPAGPAETVTLATEELSKASQVFHHCSLSLTLTPPADAGRRLSHGQSYGQMVKPQDHYDIPLHWKFSPPMPYDRSINQSIPHFASETFRIHADKLSVELNAQLTYESKKSKDGSSHMEHFKGDIDFKLDVDANIMTQLKVEEAPRGGELITTTDLLEPVALSPNVTFMLGPVPVTVLPTIDLMRLKVNRTGLLQGSFKTMLNSTIVGSILFEFDGGLGTKFKGNTTLVKAMLKPPVYFVTDDNFEMDVSLETNVSVNPFFKAGLHPKFNISVALGPGKKRCDFRPLDVGANASLDFSLTMQWMGQLSQSIPRHGVQGLLSNLLPKQLCDKGFCTGVRPGCDLKQWAMGLFVPTITFLTNRTVNRKDVPAGLSDAVGYGLSLFPGEVKVVGSFLQNQSSEEQISSITHILTKPLGNAAQQLSKRFQTQAQTPHARRLGGVGGDHEEADGFVVQLTKTHFEITDELLQRLLDYGAFRIYDGRESTHGPVRITSVALLQTEPHHQELWEQAAHAASAQRGATKLALTTSALMALVLVGLAGACVRSKRLHYRLVMAGDA